MDAKELLAKAVRKCTPPSQYRLAKRLGIKQASVSNWKSGRTKPDYEHTMELIKIAQGEREKGGVLVGLLLWLALLSALIFQPQAHAGRMHTSAVLFTHYAQFRKRLTTSAQTLWTEIKRYLPGWTLPSRVHA